MGQNGIMTLEEVWVDVRSKLEKDLINLQQLKDEAKEESEQIRLGGKIEGGKLALEQMKSNERVFPDTFTNIPR